MWSICHYADKLDDRRIEMRFKGAAVTRSNFYHQPAVAFAEERSSRIIRLERVSDMPNRPPIHISAALTAKPPSLTS